MMDTPEAPMEGDDVAALEVDQPNWLAIAHEAYKTSTDYLNANYRKQWEKNVSNFNSKHPPGSKYHLDSYKLRSRLFRPKTRSSIRRAEATYASAMFSTRDVINLDPDDMASQDGDKICELWEAVLNYRLNNKRSMRWFLTACGAFQESKIYGIVVSRQDWEYEEVEDQPGYTDEITGAEIAPTVRVVTDRPRCKLIEIENIRFDPAADWTDPVNSSPYFIEIIPMFVGDVMDMMERTDSKTGASQWKKYTRGEILAYGQQTVDDNATTRMTRHNNRTDPKDEDHKSKEFEIVWVHRNFVRKDGQDWEFYTLSTNAILTDPAPSQTLLGRNEYKIGICSIEAHRAIPAGDVELGQDLQAEANDVVNQRMDNVKLVLNRGKYVKRDANVDLMTLRRSYPGRITLMDDVAAVQEEQVVDITSSAYHEQDRLNVDFDDMMGGMAAGSVMSNRKLNETVGGMNIMNQAGNAVAEYSVRTFVETWVEPVLDDLVRLIQEYESDEILMRFAKSVGIQFQGREQLMLQVNSVASVGFGTLDPRARSQAVSQTIQAFAAAVPWAMQGIDAKSLARDLFGPLGYRDGSKFFANLGDGPPQPAGNPMVEVEKMKIASREKIEIGKAQMQYEIEMNRLALQEGLTQRDLYARLDLEERKHNLDIMKEAGRREEIKRDREEMVLKTQMGSGI